MRDIALAVTEEYEIDETAAVNSVTVASKESDGTPVIGVQVQDQYKFPFNVQISVGDIGGPSA